VGSDFPTRELIHIIHQHKHLNIMALEMNDLMALKSMGNGGGMTPYEQYMVGYKQSKRPSGVAIAGLTVASVAAVAGATAWIFSGTYANAKSKEAKEAAQSAKEVAMAYYAGVDKRLDNIGALLESEVNRRIQGDINITQSVADTISGQQSTSQSTSVENSAMATAYNQIISDRLTGRSSLDAQPVCIYSAPQPCACPGCGCNG
jgi:flagellar basal body-associated protein FliL